MRPVHRYPLLLFLVMIYLYYALIDSRETQVPGGGGGVGHGGGGKDGGGGGDGGLKRREESGNTIWASMGLCYSYNTPLKGKEKYPYKEVAPLALLLWRYHLPQVRTIVRIVYTEPELDKVRVLHSLGPDPSR